ncbi:MAG: SemiSWEET transporter [Candidatus Zixiibacteriota bacterium]
MNTATLIGLIAGTCTTTAFVPQLLKIWKSKSTRDISLWMYVVICTGIALWLIYGIIIDSLPVILANVVTLVIASAILILKIRYR